VWQRLGGPVWEEAVWADPGDSPAAAATPRLSARRFDRTVDTAWRRTSYSALSAAADPPAGATSEPEETPRDDEAGPAGADTGVHDRGAGENPADTPAP